jgi:hypothetical protein
MSGKSLQPSPFRDYHRWRSALLATPDTRREIGMPNDSGAWLVVDDADEVEWNTFRGKAEFQLGEWTMMLTESALVRWMELCELALDELRAEAVVEVDHEDQKVIN